MTSLAGAENKGAKSGKTESRAGPIDPTGFRLLRCFNFFALIRDVFLCEERRIEKVPQRRIQPLADAVKRGQLDRMAPPHRRDGRIGDASIARNFVKTLICLICQLHDPRINGVHQSHFVTSHILLLQYMGNYTECYMIKYIGTPTILLDQYIAVQL